MLQTFTGIVTIKTVGINLLKTEFFAAVRGTTIQTTAVLPIATGTTTGTTISVFGWFRFDFRLNTVIARVCMFTDVQSVLYFNVQNLFPELYGLCHATKYVTLNRCFW